jgi:hypothetical protein
MIYRTYAIRWLSSELFCVLKLRIVEVLIYRKTNSES